MTRASKSISREALGWMEVENSQPVVETPADLPVSQRRFWASVMQRAAEKGQKEDAFIARETQECAVQEIFLEEFDGASCGISTIPSLRKGRSVFPL